MMSGGGTPFENHLASLKEPAKTIMSDLRSYVKSLGANVIEDVRPHRVTYAKTMNFRIFLDVQPAGDSLVISIKHSRTEPVVTSTVRTVLEAENAKKLIAEAYSKIQ